MTMFDTNSTFYKSIKRIVILVLSLLAGLFLGGYLAYRSLDQPEPLQQNQSHENTPMEEIPID